LDLLLRELTATLKSALLERSTLPGAGNEPLDVYLGVPANANSNQRFLTVEAFREGGFGVLALLNEPSAASIEFSHRNRIASRSDHESYLLVYDLGGGTFDVSLVLMSAHTHTVLGTEGISNLGGDDFDEILADMALERLAKKKRSAPASRDELTQSELFRLLQECRRTKESLNPNSRRVVIDLEGVREGFGEIAVPAADFYERCRPLIDETLQATETLLATHGFQDGLLHTDGTTTRVLEAVYVAGGGSELPLVPRGLRERFGRRVRRSAHARSTTAIGLAIQADSSAGYVVRERFTRFFGVWREADSGRHIAFDSIFPKETPLPGPKETPLLIQRQYCPVHDIGHFRFLECSQLSHDGQPTGDITVWDEIRFPFDPRLRDQGDLDQIKVGHSAQASEQQIEEAYTCDAGGSLAVTITNHTEGYRRRYQLGRWSDHKGLITPGRRSARKKRKAK
jgi:molecular chaperone DnaK (HSP70)